MAKQTAARKVTNENSIQAAEAVIADLESKRAALVAARQQDDRDMGSVAYRAHSHGDPEANDQLDEYVESALKHDLQLKSIDAALEVARQKLADSKQAEALATDRKLAQEAREIADRIDALFASADKHLALAFDALKAADGRIEELHRLGFTFPTANQVRLNASFALQTYLMALPKYWWNELNHSGIRFLAPGERRTFSQLWARMVEPITRGIAARLGETKTEREVV